MATVGSLTVRIGANTSEFQKKIRQVNRATHDLNQKFRQVGRSMTTFVTLPLAAIGAASIKAASDVEEMRSKFNTVFGSLAKDAEEWAGTTAKAVNRSRFDLMGYLSTLQDTFVPMGFARKEAAEFSKEMAQLGIDLASFNNASEPETIDLLTSALVGNHEAVRRFGIVITEATINQELMNMGIRDGAKAATQQQKIMARYNIIMRSTKDAQGDAARTSESFANQLRGLQSAAQEAQVIIGQKLLPTVTKLVQKATEGVRAFSELDSSIQSGIVTFGGVALVVGPLAAVIAAIGVATAAWAAAIAAVVAGGAVLLQSGSDINTMLGVYITQMAHAGKATEKAVPKISRLQETLHEAGFDIGGPSLAGQALIMGLEKAGKVASEKLNPALEETKRTLSDIISRIKFLTEGMLSVGQLAFADLLAGRGMGVSFAPTSQRPTEVGSKLEEMAEKLGVAVPKLREVARVAGVATTDLAASTVAAIDISTGAINDMSHAIGGVIGGFESLGDAVSRVMRNVVANIAAVIAKMVILKTLFTIFGGGTGLIGSIVRDVAGASGITSGFGSAAASSGPSTSNVSLNVSGQLVAKGDQLIAVIDNHNSLLRS